MMKHRFFLIASLYVSQAIPLGFFIVAMPAILRREGLGLEGVGLMSALAVPWLLKFLWAPVVDRYGSARGHYRSWILPLQITCMLSVLLISQVDLRSGLFWLIVAGAVFMFASATQDVATDGLAVRLISPSERGLANGVQVGGYYLGQIAGGGLVLVLFAAFGWVPAVLSMAVMLALALVPTWTLSEPEKPRSAPSQGIDFDALRRFVGRDGGWVWAATLILFRTGEALAITMLNPMLVDRGLALEDIGVALGVFGSIAAVLGATLGGWLVARLGRKRSLLWFGLIQAPALLAYLLPLYGYIALPWVIAAVSVAAFAGGLSTAALYTSMMDRCDHRTPATDFTLQQSLAAIGPMIGAMGSGFLASAVGYQMHFVIAAAVMLGAVILVAFTLSPSLAAPAEPAAELATRA